jgi:uncharacterized protein YcsI (UPF0317 family)
MAVNLQSSKQAEFRTGAEVRRAARLGHFTLATAGAAPGFVQGNVVILPSTLAQDFRSFCLRNPKPCPVLAMSKPGEVSLPTLGTDIDIRTDVPAYRVFGRGKLIEEPCDIRRHWRDDLVTFILGCSFSFEEALLQEGIALRHISLDQNVSMYRTSIQTIPAGCFRGPLVVSMRPIHVTDVERASQVTASFPRVHGAPIHIGDPRAIGVADLSKPDYGDAAEVKKDEVPMFWACGVTPQAVIAEAKLDFCITHAPGRMLVTDLLNSNLRSTTGAAHYASLENC